MLFTARLIAFVAGLYSYYLAFFMYEDAQGLWQNRIESLWVALHDKGRTASGNTKVVFEKLAAILSTGFDRIFGARYFSWRLLGVSTCYSLGGTALFEGLRDLPFDGESAVISLTVGALLCVLATAPALFQSRLPRFVFTALTFVPLAGSVFADVQDWRVGLADVGRYITVETVLLISVLVSVLLLFLVRFTVRRISTNIDGLHIVLAIVLQIMIVWLVVIEPFRIAPRVWYYSKDLSVALRRISSFSLFSALASGAFSLMLLFVLLHKLFWPVLAQLIYPLARFKVARNLKVMAGVGTGFFLFALPLMPPSLKAILGWIAKSG